MFYNEFGDYMNNGELIKWIKESHKTVFFGGAGVSTESGLKDFRSSDGLYNEKYAYPPEKILSHSFFINNTLEFYKFYRDKMNPNGYKSNITHKVLAEMEKKGLLSSIITQNIDGFHSSAGSVKVLELHGSVKRNYCMKCHKFYNDDIVFNSSGIPKCSCGGIIKPDVVLYEEGLDDNVINEAIDEISTCDLLIIGGTSLNVYPASSLIDHFRGSNLVIINKSPTSADSKANLHLNGNIGEILSQIKV